MSEKRMKLVRDHLEAFNTRDWDRYVKSLVSNAVYEERATNRRTTGPNEIVSTLKTWTQAFPDLRGTVKNLLTQDDMVMAEIRWEGTHDGMLKGPFGEIPASGKTSSVDAVQVYHFEGDRIREFRHYFDLMTVLNQIGAPAMAGA